MAKGKERQKNQASSDKISAKRLKQVKLENIVRLSEEEVQKLTQEQITKLSNLLYGPSVDPKDILGIAGSVAKFLGDNEKAEIFSVAPSSGSDDEALAYIDGITKGYEKRESQPEQEEVVTLENIRAAKKLMDSPDFNTLFIKNQAVAVARQLGVQRTIDFFEQADQLRERTQILNYLGEVKEYINSELSEDISTQPKFEEAIVNVIQGPEAGKKLSKLGKEMDKADQRVELMSTAENVGVSPFYINEKTAPLITEILNNLSIEEKKDVKIVRNVMYEVIGRSILKNKVYSRLPDLEGRTKQNKLEVIIQTAFINKRLDEKFMNTILRNPVYVKQAEIVLDNLKNFKDADAKTIKEDITKAILDHEFREIADELSPEESDKLDKLKSDYIAIVVEKGYLSYERANEIITRDTVREISAFVKADLEEAKSEMSKGIISEGISKGLIPKEKLEEGIDAIRAAALQIAISKYEKQEKSEAPALEPSTPVVDPTPPQKDITDRYLYTPEELKRSGEKEQEKAYKSEEAEKEITRLGFEAKYVKMLGGDALVTMHDILNEIPRNEAYDETAKGIINKSLKPHMLNFKFRELAKKARSKKGLGKEDLVTLVEVLQGQNEVINDYKNAGKLSLEQFNIERDNYRNFTAGIRPNIPLVQLAGYLPGEIPDGGIDRFKAQIPSTDLPADLEQKLREVIEQRYTEGHVDSKKVAESLLSNPDFLALVKQEAGQISPERLEFLIKLSDRTSGKYDATKKELDSVKSDLEIMTGKVTGELPKLEQERIRLSKALEGDKNGHVAAIKDTADKMSGVIVRLEEARLRGLEEERRWLNIRLEEFYGLSGEIAGRAGRAENEVEKYAARATKKIERAEKRIKRAARDAENVVLEKGGLPAKWGKKGWLAAAVLGAGIGAGGVVAGSYVTSEIKSWLSKPKVEKLAEKLRMIKHRGEIYIGVPGPKGGVISRGGNLVPDEVFRKLRDPNYRK